MNDELQEALSALLDGEVPEHELLRRAFEHPEALDVLRQMVELRALVRADASTPGEAVLRSTQAAMQGRIGASRRRRWVVPAAAALLLVALGGSLGWWAAMRRSPPIVRVSEGPLEADVIADFALEATQR